MAIFVATWADPSVTTAASEMAFSRGILWCQAPIGYGIALIVGDYLHIPALIPRNDVCVSTLVLKSKHSVNNKVPASQVGTSRED